MIRSEFSGVKAGDHVYGVLREILYLLFIARIQYSDTNVYTPGSVPKLLHRE